jgi:hypothetical protein
MNNLIIDSKNNLTINVKPIVEINTGISLAGHKSELPIKIIADFTNIPESQHEVFLDTFKYFYNTEVNVYHNPYNKIPKTIEEKKKDWTINRIIDILFKTKQR